MAKPGSALECDSPEQKSSLSLGQILRHPSVLTKPPDSVSILSECPTWPQKPRCSLALNQPENLVTAYPGATYPRDLSPGTLPTSALSLSESDGEGAQLVYLDMTQNIVAYDIISWCLSSAGTYCFICMCFSLPPTVCVHVHVYLCASSQISSWTVLATRHTSPNGMTLHLLSWGFTHSFPFLCRDCKGGTGSGRPCV